MVRIFGRRAIIILFFALLFFVELQALEQRPYCRNAPIVNATPLNQSAKSGTTLTYNITITNNNTLELCGEQSYLITPTLPSYLTLESSREQLSLSINTQKSTIVYLKARSNASAPAADYNITLKLTLSAETAVLRQAVVTYHVSETSAPAADLLISRLEWHCESADGKNHFEYCRKGDLFRLDALEVSNLGGTFNGELTLGINSTEAAASGVSYFKNVISTDNSKSFPFDVAYSVKITSQKSAKTQFILYPIPPDSKSANNIAVASAEITNETGCQYHFPECEEGFICKKNKCVSLQQLNATPTPKAKGEKIVANASKKPFAPISEVPNEIGGVCSYNSDCETNLCKRNTCIKAPSSIVEQIAELWNDIAWGLTHLEYLFA